DDGDGKIDCADSDCVGYACDDGDGCTVSDRCANLNQCMGSPRACASPPGTCFADGGTCTGGACVYAAAPGRSCDDSNACTMNDLCRADAGCAGTPVQCTVHLDDGGCFSPTAVCAPSTGACSYPVRLGMPCDDGNACSQQDSCSSAGVCLGSLYTCSALPE